MDVKTATAEDILEDCKEMASIGMPSSSELAHLRIGALQCYIVHLVRERDRLINALMEEKGDAGDT